MCSCCRQNVLWVTTIAFVITFFIFAFQTTSIKSSERANACAPHVMTTLPQLFQHLNSAHKKFRLCLCAFSSCDASRHARASRMLTCSSAPACHIAVCRLCRHRAVHRRRCIDRKSSSV